MKYTNNLNLPEPIVNAITNDPYEKGEGTDYSVTELIDPPRKIALQRENDDEITVDVADEIYKLLGQSIHTLLERAGVPERRFSITVAGKTISGRIDRYTKAGLLQDWKLTTMYRFKAGQVPFEVEAQLNCYAELVRQYGLKVTTLQAVPIFRDWSKLAVKRDREIPRHQTLVVNVNLWPTEKAKQYLEERVRLHEEAKIKLPDCTPIERWARSDSWAVMKPGRKKAVRVLASQKLAQEFLVMQKDREKLTIVFRAGESVRCASYCRVSAFCSQWKRLQNPPKPLRVASPVKAVTPSPVKKVRAARAKAIRAAAKKPTKSAGIFKVRKR